MKRALFAVSALAFGCASPETTSSSRPPEPGILEITAPASAVDADSGRATVQLMLRDRLGAGLAHFPLKVFTTQGRLGDVRDEGAGLYSVDVWDLATSGEARVVATAAGLVNGASLQITAGRADPSASFVELSPGFVAADGHSEAVVRITPLDHHGNRLPPGTNVKVLTARGAVPASFDAERAAWFARLTSTTPKIDEVRVEVDGVELQRRVTTEFRATATSLQLEADRMTPTAGTRIRLLASVGAAEAMGQGSLSLSASRPTATIDTPREIAPGVFEAWLTDTQAGAVTVTAMEMSSGAQSAMTLNVLPGDPAHLALTPASTQVTADAGAVAVAVRLTDALGNAVSGVIPVVVASRGTVGTPILQGDGAWLMNIAGLRTTGDVQVEASFGELRAETSVEVLPGAPDAGACSVSVVHPNVRADGVDAAAVSVTGRDRYGNLVRADAVSLIASTPSVTVSNGTAQADGSNRFEVRSSEVGTVLFTPAITFGAQRVFLNDVVVNFVAP